MFNVGDKIVYPMHGAGTIDSIEEKDILGEKQSYYILRMPGGVKVMIPTAKAEEVGVRNIIDKSSADRVINVLEQNETDMDKNWNKRYRDNMDKMKSGDIYEVADVVRNLSFKQKEKVKQCKTNLSKWISFSRTRKSRRGWGNSWNKNQHII